MCPIVFQGRPSNFTFTQNQNAPILTQLSVYGLELMFEFTDGLEIMHKAWRSMEEVPYCFLRSSVKFQGHTDKKVADFDLN